MELPVKLIVSQMFIPMQASDTARVEFIENIGYVLLGVVLSFFLTLLLPHLEKRTNARRIKKICGKYEGIYLGYEKYNNEKPSLYWELTLEENRFTIVKGISLTGHEDFDGEIVMAPPTYVRGHGYYKHKTSVDGVIRFGFLDIQLAQDSLMLVHIIIHKDGSQNSDAYRFEKKLSSQKNEIEDSSREQQQMNKPDKDAQLLDRKAKKREA